MKDLDVLVAHRHRMWTDISERTEAEMADLDGRYRPWARRRLRTGEMVGLIAWTHTGIPVASGCVWFREDQPRPHASKGRMPYIMSIYTISDHRRRGIAGKIVEALVAVAKRRGYPQVRLNASDQGKSVYARVGFERTTEMRLWIDPALRRTKIH